jgi:hypothetical protein
MRANPSNSNSQKFSDDPNHEFPIQAAAPSVPPFDLISTDLQNTDPEVRLQTNEADNQNQNDVDSCDSRVRGVEDTSALYRDGTPRKIFPEDRKTRSPKHVDNCTKNLIRAKAECYSEGACDQKRATDTGTPGSVDACNDPANQSAGVKNSSTQALLKSAPKALQTEFRASAGDALTSAASCQTAVKNFAYVKQNRRDHTNHSLAFETVERNRPDRREKLQGVPSLTANGRHTKRRMGDEIGYSAKKVPNDAQMTYVQREPGTEEVPQTHKQIDHRGSSSSESETTVSSDEKERSLELESRTQYHCKAFRESTLELETPRKNPQQELRLDPTDEKNKPCLDGVAALDLQNGTGEGFAIRGHGPRVSIRNLDSDNKRTSKTTALEMCSADRLTAEDGDGREASLVGAFRDSHQLRNPMMNIQNGTKTKKSPQPNAPFRRVQEERVFASSTAVLDPVPRDEYGQRTWEVLSAYQGKAFRKMKVKKKRSGSFCGKISLEPRSVKFNTNS